MASSPLVTGAPGRRSTRPVPSCPRNHYPSYTPRPILPGEPTLGLHPSPRQLRLESYERRRRPTPYCPQKAPGLPDLSSSSRAPIEGLLYSVQGPCKSRSVPPLSIRTFDDTSVFAPVLVARRRYLAQPTRRTEEVGVKGGDTLSLLEDTTPDRHRRVRGRPWWRLHYRGPPKTRSSYKVTLCTRGLTGARVGRHVRRGPTTPFAEPPV